MKRLTLCLLCLLLLCTATLSACKGRGGSENGTESNTADKTEADLLFMVDNEVYARFSKGGIPVDPEKQGFRFDGWYFDEDVWEDKLELTPPQTDHFVTPGEAESILSNNKTETVTYHLPDYLVSQLAQGEDICVWAKFTELPPEGYTAGKLCYTQSVSLFGDGNPSFNLADTNKVTVINFWGTWCSPCVNELPHFDDLAREYGDTIAIVALHSQEGVENAPAFIAQNYADSPILFGYDVNNSYYKKLGGIGSFPMTLVIDANGIVVANRIGALSKVELHMLIEQALANTSDIR